MHLSMQLYDADAGMVRTSDESRRSWNTALDDGNILCTVWSYFKTGYDS
jgi:hypothetical protein